MSEEIKIKRCMFCGKKIKPGCFGGVPPDIFVYCVESAGGCGATGPYAATEAEAIAKWNAAPRRKRKQAADNLPDHSGLNCRCGGSR